MFAGFSRITFCLLCTTTGRCRCCLLHIVCCLATHCLMFYRALPIVHCSCDCCLLRNAVLLRSYCYDCPLLSVVRCPLPLYPLPAVTSATLYDIRCALVARYCIVIPHEMKFSIWCSNWTLASMTSIETTPPWNDCLLKLFAGTRSYSCGLCPDMKEKHKSPLPPSPSLLDVDIAHLTVTPASFLLLPQQPTSSNSIHRAGKVSHCVCS